MIGFISSKSKRAELGQDPVRQSLLVTRYDPERAEKEECLRLEDIKVCLLFSIVFVPLFKKFCQFCLACGGLCVSHAI